MKEERKEKVIKIFLKKPKGRIVTLTLLEEQEQGYISGFDIKGEFFKNPYSNIERTEFVSGLKHGR